MIALDWFCMEAASIAEQIPAGKEKDLQYLRGSFVSLWETFDAFSKSMQDAITNTARDETVQKAEAFIVLAENMTRLGHNQKIENFEPKNSDDALKNLQEFITNAKTLRGSLHAIPEDQRGVMFITDRPVWNPSEYNAPTDEKQHALWFQSLCIVRSVNAHLQVLKFAESGKVECKDLMKSILKKSLEDLRIAGNYVGAKDFKPTASSFVTGFLLMLGAGLTEAQKQEAASLLDRFLRSIEQLIPMLDQEWTQGMADAIKELLGLSSQFLKMAEENYGKEYAAKDVQIKEEVAEQMEKDATNHMEDGDSGSGNTVAKQALANQAQAAAILSGGNFDLEKASEEVTTGFTEKILRTIGDTAGEMVGKGKELLRKIQK
jgi:plasmid maintenance system antidote protein VapI